MAINKTPESLITDNGVIKKNDPLGLITMIVSNILVAALIVLSVLAFL